MKSSYTLFNSNQSTNKEIWISFCTLLRMTFTGLFVMKIKLVLRCFINHVHTEFNKNLTHGLATDGLTYRWTDLVRPYDFSLTLKNACQPDDTMQLR